jgi:hypothetical protein
VHPELVRRIDDALAISWLPFEAHMALLNGCRAALGADKFRAFCCEFVQASLQSSVLFAKQAAFMLELVDGGAWSLVRALPVSCRYVFDAAGELEVDSSGDDRVARVTYDGLPAEHARSDVWSASWLGTFDALAERALDRFGKTMHVEETRYEPERGLFEWTARIRLKTDPPPVQHVFSS